MKKVILPLIFAASACLLAGCGNTGGGNNTGKPQDPIDLGTEFQEQYYPNKDDNKVASIVGNSTNKMKIDVALDYDGTEDGWQALANEYMRLCGNLVTVNIVSGLDTAAYTERLRNEEVNPRTDWDIVQGNLLNDTEGHCVNLLDTIRSSKKPYAGNKPWVEVIEEAAYVTNVTGSTDYTYLLNTESLSTAWFLNTTAATKAGVTDYSPETWNELIETLDKLQQAGYKYPLGLSLNSDSINGSQFSWLLRIYGDYFFRQCYEYTSKTFDSITGEDEIYSYDKEAENQESYSTYTFSFNRALTVLMDESSEYYRGSNSPLYQDFVYQFSRLAKYIRPDAYSLTFNDVRSSFMAQKAGNNGDEAPQIMLDYTGSGLSFLNAESLKNNLDFFDYPTIESEYVEAGTLTRDVGGNGGYLALLNYANKKQQDLNKDFLKFVLSPYGQTIYYKALAEKGASPKGLTTVKNDLVIIPENWKAFFQTDKIQFTGLADSNNLLGLGVISFQHVSEVERKSVELWQALLRTNNQKTVEQFTTDWHYALHSNWKKVASMHSWKEDAWEAKNFDNPNYIAA